MLADSRWMADGERGRVNEAESRAHAVMAPQIGGEREEDRRHELDKPGVAHQTGDNAAQMDPDMLGVVRLVRVMCRNLKYNTIWPRRTERKERDLLHAIANDHRPLDILGRAVEWQSGAGR